MNWMVVKGIKIFAFMTLAIGVFGWLVMTLWNWLIPSIFDLPQAQITFLQALGLLLLTRILFGGFRFWPGWGQHKGKSAYWRKKWEAKMANMPPEQREKWKQHWSSYCGYQDTANQDEPVSSEETQAHQQ